MSEHTLPETAEVYSHIVNQRKSVRAFLPKPVPQELLDSVFAAALRAPSNCNTQPWQTHVASGARLEALRQSLPETFMRGEFSMDFPYDGKYDGVYKERQYAAAEALYSAMGIKREEKDKRNVAFMRNFTFFDAPHVAFMFLPAPFGLREACDLGMYAQTLMLSMVAHGLGCCPQTALSFLAEPVRKELDVAPENKLLFGISFGYEDTEAPANTCYTDRGALADITHFHS
ncbi:MAG: nitroreductase [Pseudomonadota bacterium]